MAYKRGRDTIPAGCNTIPDDGWQTPSFVEVAFDNSPPALHLLMQGVKCAADERGSD